MDKIFTIIQVVAPIFLAVALGMLARKKAMFTTEQIQSLQSFIVKICLPCLLFRSCLTADLGPQTLTSMVIVIPFLVISTVWAFRLGRKKFPYHNLPMMFCCRETGMLGIPLFMILFGAENAFYMGVLDLAQAPVAFATIGILSAAEGKSTSAGDIVKQIFRSPLILMSLLGVALNLLGVWDLLVKIGADGAVTATLDFLSQPVSMVMLFCVGFFFSLSKESAGPVLKVSGIEIGYFAVVAVLMQLLLGLMPGVNSLTRWSMLFYCLLPCSYLSPGLGRTESDLAFSSGVCSLLTILCLVIFTVLTAIVA